MDVIGAVRLGNATLSVTSTRSPEDTYQPVEIVLEVNSEQEYDVAIA
jgi:hypothetical protein